MCIWVSFGLKKIFLTDFFFLNQALTNMGEILKAAGCSYNNGEMFMLHLYSFIIYNAYILKLFIFSCEDHCAA